MMRAEHGPLHEAETALCRVDVNEAAKAHILVIAEWLTVVWPANSRPIVRVGRQFVGHKCDLRSTVSHHGVAQRLGLHVRDMERMAIAVTVNQRETVCFFGSFVA